MTNPIKLYLASPYSHEEAVRREVKYEQVRDFVYLLHDKHYPSLIIYSPIVACHPLALTKCLAKGINYWWDLNKCYIDWCDWFGIYKIDGWDTSEGVAKEFEYAGDRGKTIVEFPS